MSIIFISYSRKDINFVQKLNKKLETIGQETWVDWKDIPISADWWKEIQVSIEKSDTFAFIISPESVHSKICRREIAHAVRHNKRIIPILHREGFKKQKLHTALSRYNWLYFRDCDKFEKSLRLLTSTVNADLDYVENHTWLTVKASEWERENTDSTYLLKGSALTEAEAWIEGSSDKKPQPTDLQKTYILASQSAETAQLVYRYFVTYVSNLVKVLTRIRISRRYLWAKSIEWLLFIIVVFSSLLKLFDYSYIPFRDSYLKLAPSVTVWYGETFKGIEPERVTVSYLATVDELLQQVEKPEDLETPVSQQLLAQLREQSIQIVDENPFQIAGKPGDLSKITNPMREHLEEDSAKAAFRKFWSAQHLGQPDMLSTEIAFFDAEIRPILEANYFRGINQAGSPIELYWRVDSIFFGSFFVLEFILRLLSLKLKSNIEIKRAISMRWYDLALLLPIIFGRAVYFWCIIPVLVRAYQLGLLDNALSFETGKKRKKVDLIGIEQYPIQR